MKSFLEIVFFVVVLGIGAVQLFYEKESSDPFVRPIDILAKIVSSKQEPDEGEIPITEDFKMDIQRFYTESLKQKYPRFIKYIEENNDFVVTPVRKGYVQRILVSNLSPDEFSITIYLSVEKAKNDEAATYYCKFVSSKIKKELISSACGIDGENNEQQVDPRSFVGNSISLWDLAIYGAIEFGPCCR